MEADPAIRGTGKLQGSTLCCSLVVSDPPSFDGLQVDTWSITHCGNKDLLILRMTSAAFDSDSEPSSSEPDSPSPSAAAPAQAVPTQIPHIGATRTAVQAVTGTQVVTAAASRPPAAVAGSLLPPTLLAGNTQPAARNGNLSADTPPPLRVLGPARPPNCAPHSADRGKVHVIVSERLTIRIKTLNSLFPFVRLPLAAYIRVMQDDIIGSKYLPVTISEGPLHTSTSRVLLVEGLSGGQLCGKALISWARDPIPVRERLVTPGPFSTDRVCMLLEVASPPPGTNIPIDARQAIERVRVGMGEPGMLANKALALWTHAVASIKDLGIHMTLQRQL